MVEEVTLVGNRHLRFKLRTKEGSSISAIKLRATPNERSIVRNMLVRAVYNVCINHYMGSQRLEIKISAIEPI